MRYFSSLQQNIIRFFAIKRSVFTFLLFVLPIISIGQINIDNNLFLAKFALNKEDYPKAIDYCNEVLNLRQEESTALFLRAYAKFYLGDFEGAKSDIDRSIKINPFVIEYYHLRGMCNLNLDAYSDAIKDYETVLHNSPFNLDAKYNLAYAYYQNKDLKQANIINNEVLKKNANYKYALLLKSQILLEKKDTISSIEQINKILSIYPDEVNLRIFKGQYLLEHKQYAEADSCFEQAAQNNHQNATVYFLHALTKSALNKFDESRKLYNKAIALNKNFVEAYYNRALLLALIGADNDAIKDFNVILHKNPQNTLALYNRAILYTNIGAYRDAIRDYSYLLKRFPNFLYGYYARAKLYRKLGNIKQALNDESFLARQELDIAFAMPKRHIIRKINNHLNDNFSDFDQPINTNKTNNLFSNTNLDTQGVIKDIGQYILPPYTLHVSTKSGATHSAFIKGLSSINEQILRSSEDEWHQYFNQRQEDPIIVPSLYNDSIRQSSRVERIMFNSTSKALPLLINSIASLEQGNILHAKYEIKNAFRYHEYSSLFNFYLSSLHYILAKKDKTMSENERQINLALELINKAIKEEHEQAIFYYNRSLIYAFQHQYTLAIDDLSTAIENDHHLGPAYFNRALLYLKTNQIQLAKKDFSKAGECGITTAYHWIKTLRSYQKEKASTSK